MLVTNTTDQAARIVSAYVSHNSIPSSAVPDLLAAVHEALRTLMAPSVAGSAAKPPVATPSQVEVRKSIRPDGLVSFIDGRTYKTLKRHLSAHGITPDEYRRRFGLGKTYPLVCPSYSERRSQIARSNQLGVPGGRSMQRSAA